MPVARKLFRLQAATGNVPCWEVGFDDSSLPEAFGEQYILPVLDLGGTTCGVVVVVQQGFGLERQQYATVNPAQQLFGGSYLGPKAAVGAKVMLEAVRN